MGQSGGELQRLSPLQCVRVCVRALAVEGTAGGHGKGFVCRADREPVARSSRSLGRTVSPGVLRSLLFRCTTLVVGRLSNCQGSPHWREDDETDRRVLRNKKFVWQGMNNSREMQKSVKTTRRLCLNCRPRNNRGSFGETEYCSIPKAYSCHRARVQCRFSSLLPRAARTLKLVKGTIRG